MAESQMRELAPLDELIGEAPRDSEKARCLLNGKGQLRLVLIHGGISFRPGGRALHEG